MQEFVSGQGRGASCGVVHLQLLPPHAQLASPCGAGRHRNGPNLPEGSERERARRTAKPAALWPLLLLLDRFSGDAGTGGKWGVGEAQAQPSQRRGPRACPDVSPWGGVCWRPVGRPLPLSAAFPSGGPEPCGGRHGAPPEPPAAECAPPVGGLALGLWLTVTLFPFRKNRTGFPGTRAQVPPPSRVSKMRLAARACGALRLRVCRWECDPNGPAWFSWVAPSAPGPRRPTIGCWASLSGCGLASVHARLPVRPGCGGVLHS